MFSIPGKTPVTVTQAAEARIARLMEDKQAFALRIGLKKGGCAGMEYTMELAEAAAPGDEAIEQGAARVLIAPTAQMFLFGTEIDYESGMLDSGFRFRNPNVTDSCGCGESVNFAPIEGARAGS
ncbi:iron-sulfur cluster assembly accessory protein [Paracoccus suum]|uniref:Iron-sulfur cluster assembly accessory protein n=1 Tax=Paracoccus suum TaxID=2259340 RepID=A0A344PK86_9RHOB|nr:iron-sulfur cluster assembly accessory protein [Paracoccus suum]AXC49791.1 iron-sulfur cluster assembly accessory protein [Paracoccus suum]